jgi:hypothetical protein
LDAGADVCARNGSVFKTLLQHPDPISKRIVMDHIRAHKLREEDQNECIQDDVMTDMKSTRTQPTPMDNENDDLFQLPSFNQLLNDPIVTSTHVADEIFNDE